MADQLTTVSKKRVLKKIGVIQTEEMKEIEKAIKLQLDML